MLTGSRGDIVKIGDFGLSKNIKEYASNYFNFNNCTLTVVLNHYFEIINKYDSNALKE